MRCLEKIIAVDAMTAEKGISVVVQGSIEAAEEYDYKIILVGDEKKINEIYTNPHPNISIEHASDFIEMEEKDVIRAVLQRENSSIVVAAKLVCNGKASALVSAGNTGATAIAIKKYFECIEGVKKIPIITQIPTKIENKYSIIGDVGVNVDCTPEDLVKFAIMENAYLINVLGIKDPKIALLNIGEEKLKGGSMYRKTYGLLEQIDFNFIGNREPKDIYSGEVDGFVCSGDVGNYVLKTAEATAGFIKKEIKEGLYKKRNLWLSLPGFFGMYRVYKELSHKTDKSNYGGAIALGTKNGKAVITHGSSNHVAIRESIRVAQNYVEHDINNIIEKEIKRYKRLFR